MNAYFITATGTDIGKTYVTAALVRALRARALKPVVSGFPGSDVRLSDSAVLLDAMGEAPNQAAIARISPWRFTGPLSPDMAAAREGRSIPYTELLAFCRDEIARTDGPLFIEGVGGVMVPLDGRHTVLDWMTELDIPIVLVAGAYLGTISHTLTALSALAAKGLKPHALYLNDRGDGPVPVAETAASIARFAPGLRITHEISALAALLG